MRGGSPEGPRTVRIGTRGSALARWQASWVGERLRSRFSGLQIQYVIVQTQGDRILDVPLAQVGGKGLFVKEIEDALLEGRVDVAVHSMKDLPVELPEGLQLAAIPEREDPRDVLISSGGLPFTGLRQGARVGTSSLRRRAQLLYHRADLKVVGLRGNVDTRIRKLESGGLDAVVLAAAGVARMGFGQMVTEVMAPEDFVPAIGQGALGIEIRGDDEELNRMIGELDHGFTRTCVEAERAFLRKLHGGCQVPIGALATIEGGMVHLRGMVADVDGSPMFRGEIRGPLPDSARRGVELAERLLQQGAGRVLEALYGKMYEEPGPP